MNKLVSIITPFYNAETFLKEAIDSVLAQTHENWELLLVNDGSTDKSKAMVKTFDDSRIRYFEQENKGVSAARNVALNEMKGDFFCFLDADDQLTENSLRSRLLIFAKDEKIGFVDGGVRCMNYESQDVVRSYLPSFVGNPLKELCMLRSSCFFGPSWMIKKEVVGMTRFSEGMTHSEDLDFYIQLAFRHQVRYMYAFTDEVILHYRVSKTSAMNNLSGLEKGYNAIYKRIVRLKLFSAWKLFQLRLKIIKIMFLSYLVNGQNPIEAMRSVVRLAKIG